MDRAGAPFVVADQSSVTETAVAPLERSSGTTVRYLTAMVGVIAVVFVGIGLANYLLNPLDYSEQYTHQVAPLAGSSRTTTPTSTSGRSGPRRSGR